MREQIILGIVAAGLSFWIFPTETILTFAVFAILVLGVGLAFRAVERYQFLKQMRQRIEHVYVVGEYPADGLNFPMINDLQAKGLIILTKPNKVGEQAEKIRKTLEQVGNKQNLKVFEIRPCDGRYVGETAAEYDERVYRLVTEERSEHHEEMRRNAAWYVSHHHNEKGYKTKPIDPKSF